ncbi:Serpin domain containing protein, partial [Asbolus verrucosus]
EVVRDYPNFLISPYSVQTVLAFVQSGCKGETASEIRDSLNLPDDDAKIESFAKDLQSVLKENDEYTLRMAKKLFVKKGFQINEGFKTAATEVYKADVENVVFVPNTKAVDTMIDWAERQTNKKIKNFVSLGISDETARAVVINALYFKGNWSSQFVTYFTRKDDFYKADGNVVKVDTMHHYEEMFDYYEDSERNAKFLKLPIEGEDVSMVIVLPKQKGGLRSLENRIVKVTKHRYFRKTYVNVALPKFKIESTLNLSETLRNVKISDTLLRSRPKNFIANHPFIFYIRVKNVIIFIGRVSEPSH